MHPSGCGIMLWADILVVLVHLHRFAQITIHMLVWTTHDVYACPCVDACACMYLWASHTLDRDSRHELSAKGKFIALAMIQRSPSESDAKLRYRLSCPPLSDPICLGVGE